MTSNKLNFCNELHTLLYYKIRNQQYRTSQQFLCNIYSTYYNSLQSFQDKKDNHYDYHVNSNNILDLLLKYIQLNYFQQ